MTQTDKLAYFNVLYNKKYVKSLECTADTNSKYIELYNHIIEEWRKFKAASNLAILEYYMILLDQITKRICKISNLDPIAQHYCIGCMHIKLTDFMESQFSDMLLFAFDLPPYDVNNRHIEQLYRIAQLMKSKQIIKLCDWPHKHICEVISQFVMANAVRQNYDIVYAYLLNGVVEVAKILSYQLQDINKCIN